MKWLKNRESGQTLIMALILLAVGSLLVVPLLNQSFTNLRYHQSIECRTLNSYTADSGVEYVLAKLYGNPGVYTETPLQESFTLNNRTVDITADYQGSGIFKVNSTASGGGCGSATITTYVNLGAGSFTYVIAAQTSISLEKTVVDSAPDPGDGDIRSNGNIVLVGGNVVVNGDAYAVDTITGQVVYGAVLEGASPIQFPGDYSGLYEIMAKEGGTNLGDMVINEDQSLGPLYIDGNLDVKPNTIVTLTGTVYVTGVLTVDNGRFEGEHNVVAESHIEINGGGIFSAAVPLFTSVNGNITLAGALVDAVVYAPNGSVTVSNVGYLNGAIGGNTVTVSNAYIYYAAMLRGREDLPGGLLYTISYSYD